MMKLIFYLAFLTFPFSISAHHSVAVIFNTTEVVEAEGEITSLIWRNPHVRFELSVEGEGGEAEIWNIETTSLTNFRRRGLEGQLLHLGDTIRVAGNPARSGSGRIYVENILLANGEEEVTESRGQPRWSDKALGGDGPSGDGDGSALQLGIFRVWSSPLSQGLLFPEDVSPIFDYDRYPLTASARQAVEAFDPVADSPILNCVSKGMPTIMEQPYPMRFFLRGGDIILHMEEFDTFRTIHMAPDATAEGQPGSKLGYSTGRWEEGSLIVITRYANWGYFDVVGVPLSEDPHIAERFTLNENGARLDYTLTVTDPETFTEPVTLSKFWAWYPEVTVEPYECQI